MMLANRRDDVRGAAVTGVGGGPESGGAMTERRLPSGGAS